MTRTRSERGSALLLCIIILIVVVGVSGAYLSFSLINMKKTNDDVFALQALYIAETGASIMMGELKANQSSTPSPTPQPIAVAGGQYSVNVVWFGNDGEDNDNSGDADGNDPFEQNFYRVEIEGTFTNVTRRLELILNKEGGGAFWNAIFAGNSSGDPRYTMDFSGTDLVQGDIYIGGSINTADSAALRNEDGSGISNQVMYKDSYTDSSSESNPNYVQGSQSPLDIRRDPTDSTKTIYETKAEAAFSTVTSSADYANLSYVHVTNELDSTRASKGTHINENAATGENFRGSVGGSNNGVATQITDTKNPAHWFRLEPHDITGPGTTNSKNRAWTYTKTDTGKRDYFIEDPTENVASGTINSDANAELLNIGENGNNKVYFIDGNLWAANSPTYTFKFKHNDPAMKVTVVVKGNVYWTDNLYYQNKQDDAVAFITVNDDNYPSLSPTDFSPSTSKNLPHAVGSDTTTSAFAATIGADLRTPEGREEAARQYNRIHGSGNIFFGDPGGGTTEYFEAFQYAENNFYDNNLGGSGTKLTKLYGNMTAGNQIVIKRKYGVYKPLQVVYDDKIRTGKSSPPDLPATPGFGNKDWAIASWKQLP